MPFRYIFILFALFYVSLLPGDTGASSDLKSGGGIGNALPPCPLFGDTYGRWVNVQQLTHGDGVESIQKHFYGNPPGEALNFTNIWLPSNCSYHRFTNETLQLAVIDQMRKLGYPVGHANNDSKLQIFFVGDSALRGIYCGISRILAGSEVLGPLNENRVCGGGNVFPYVYALSTSKYGIFFPINFGDHLTMQFVYIKDFHTKGFDITLECAISCTKRPPLAVIMSTGAWDYYGKPRTKENTTEALLNPPEYCATNETDQASLRRAEPGVNATMREMAKIAQGLKVRLIYRNNHYNARYAAECADQRFEPMLAGISGWEIWDNRRMSKEVWRNQTRDGFHFDRTRVGALYKHKEVRTTAENAGKEYPGQLEMQPAQSLLNALLHSSLPVLFPAAGNGTV